MKKKFYILFVIILFSGCTQRIVRTGYDINKSDYKESTAAIIREGEPIDTIAVKVGEIKLGDSFFANSCSEEHAINILKNESSALNADLIVITEEKRPEISSYCYRCRAEFYKFTVMDTLIASDQFYSPDKIRERVAKANNDRFNDVLVLTIACILFSFFQ